MFTTMFVTTVLGFIGAFASISLSSSKYSKYTKHTIAFILINAATLIFCICYKVVEHINSPNFLGNQ